MKIGLSYDLKEAVRLGGEQPEDALEEYDSLETVNGIAGAIEAQGHSTVRLGGGREFLSRILAHSTSSEQAEKVDLVFNISEGLGSYRSREAQVPSVLEMLDIPYSGADPQCLAVCLDKHLTKQIVALAGVCTPRWCLIKDADELKALDPKSLPCPAFVKPAYEGSSKGIRLSSRINDPEQAAELVAALLERYRQPVIVEQFISGEEVTVGLVGNKPPELVGIMGIVPKKKDANFIYSLEVKRDYERLVDYVCPARLDKSLLKKIEEFSLKAFEALDCRDFARVDFRVSPDGVPYFLEINPLAGLNPRSSDLCIMARLMGKSYNELIAAILSAALERYGLEGSHCLQ